MEYLKKLSKGFLRTLQLYIQTLDNYVKDGGPEAVWKYVVTENRTSVFALSW